MGFLFCQLQIRAKSDLLESRTETRFWRLNKYQHVMLGWMSGSSTIQKPPSCRLTGATWESRWDVLSLAEFGALDIC